MSSTPLAEVEAGTEVYIPALITATVEAPAAQSTAITFSLSAPDGTLTTVSSPNAAITGPVAGTDPDNPSLATTRWVYKTPVLMQAGNYAIEAQSTGGIAVAKRGRIHVPVFTPFLTP